VDVAGFLFKLFSNKIGEAKSYSVIVPCADCLLLDWVNLSSIIVMEAFHS